MYYLDIAQVLRAGKLLFISELLTNLAICVVKISVALFLLRIGGLRRWLKVSLYATVVLLVSSTTVFVVILFVQCRPIAGNWNPVIKRTAKCLSTSALTDVSSCSAGTLPESHIKLPTLIMFPPKPSPFSLIFFALSSHSRLLGILR